MYKDAFPPADANSGAELIAQIYENDKMNKLVDDTAPLVTGLARENVVKWSTANGRWELCDGTVSLAATDMIGIVEYVGTPDTTGQVRITGVYTDNTLAANTAYYCQSDGALGTTATKVFIGYCTASGRMVIAQGRAGSVSGGNYFGDESDGAKTFAVTTYLGHARISKYAVASNVVTITTTAAHGFTTGNLISIQQCTLTALNNTAPPLTGAFSAGAHYYSITVTSTTAFTFSKTTTDVAETAEVNVDATCCKWDGPTIIKNYTDLTINSGVTVTPAARCKGLLIYATGNAAINGTLTMTARGAAATGDDCGLCLFTPYLLDSDNIMLTAFPVPAAGAAGETAVIYSGNQTTGAAGVNGQCGGGGAGGGHGYNNSYGGAGAAGTSYSGGTGGGGAGSDNTTTVRNGNAGTANGGAGGDGNQAATYKGGGGAGNPGGAGYNLGTGGNGTGGLLVLLCKGNLVIGATGIVSADGSAGGNGGDGSSDGCAGGGGSGGGSVNLFHGGTVSNSGTVRANGGAGGTVVSSYARNGGAGGAGTTRIVKVVAA